MSRIVHYKFYLMMVFSLLLAGCDTDKIRETELALQKNLFMQSIQLIESAGSQLQIQGLTEDNLVKAMAVLDEALKKAYQVQPDFLGKLDARMPKLYQDYLIKGVEDWRIGVEASDRAQQVDGLKLLQQWEQFWEQQQSDVLTRLKHLDIHQ